MICVSKNNKDEIINAFASGAKLKTTSELPEFDVPEPVLFRSIVKSEFIQYRLEHNLPFYYVDSGYFGNFKSTQNPEGKKLWHRIVKNGLQHSDIIPRDTNRWKRFGINIHKTRGVGKHILLVLPSEKPCKFYDLNLKDWTEQTIVEIQKHTDRPIRIREKERLRADRLKNTIYQDLDGAHAMVTFQSIAAVESTIFGVPAFTLAPTAADPVCNKNLKDLENPRVVKKEKLIEWASHLAYGQFHMHELFDGRAYRMLLKDESN